MARKPKATSPKIASQKVAAAKATAGASEKEKSATRRSAAKPPAPGADEAGEFASPACSAHEVDPAYMMAPAKPAAPAEKSKIEPAKAQPAADGGGGGTAAEKAPPPKPARSFNQPPKPSWADRHAHAPRSHGQGRMRVGRPHGRGQGG